MTGGSPKPEDDAVPKTVVVPLDGSDFALRAVPIAATLARCFGAELALMTTPMTREPVGRDEKPPWLEEAATASGYERVHTLLAGDNYACPAIAALVDDLPGAVVCMTTRGHGRIAGTALGSMAQEVVRTLSRPVVLVGPQCDEQWRADGPLIVCHDGSIAADAILAPARMWAHALNEPIVIVHVFHPLDVESSREPTQDIARAIEFLEPDDVRVVASSYPVGAINALVEELNPSLVAMSTHGRTGLARIVLGSVATDVVHDSPCPVLVTRPRNL